MSLFQKHHYEWLAAFARHELPTGDRIALCNALAHEGSQFNRYKFECASGIAEYLAGREAQCVPRWTRHIKRTWRAVAHQVQYD